MSSGGFTLSAAMLTGMFVSCILYGIFLILFCGTLYVFFYKRTTPQPNYTLLTASTFIFLVTTCSLVVGCLRTFDGLIVFQGTIDPDVFFEGDDGWQYTLQIVLLIAEALTADYIMIYRCWAVWGHRWHVVALGGFLWVCSIATAIGSVVILLTPSTTAYFITLQRWAIAFASITFAQNVLITSLTAYRLWSVDRSATAYRKTTLMPIMRIVVESGAIYAATLLAYLVVETIGDYAVSLFFVALFMPLIGITFSLIIVRVGLGLTRGSSQPQSNHNRSTAAGPIPMQLVKVTVQRDSEAEMANINDTGSGFEGIYDSRSMKD